MKLVYEDSGELVLTGDVVKLDDGDAMVTYFREPHKPSSSGKVCVKYRNTDVTREFYVNVIGAKWIDREDQ